MFLDSKAITKVRFVILIVLIVVAGVGGALAYALWRASLPPPENIIIGVCSDIDQPIGKSVWHGALVAAEHINAEGGILGRNLTVIAEDDDSETPPGDIAVASNALTKLITIDKADFIMTPAGFPLVYQDICSEHKKILFTTLTPLENLTQRVIDNYDKYKYYFRTGNPNSSMTSEGMLGDAITVGKYTGFTKVALLFNDHPVVMATLSSLTKSLPDHGFQIVHSALCPLAATDFTSYLAAIEESGAEILITFIINQGVIPFVKEWYDRQSPFIIWGAPMMAGDSNFWNLTEGKCESVSSPSSPVVAGYPLTNKTLPTREAFIQRWGAVELPGIYAYDTVRFILSDAILRAGTIETEAVIKALEKTNVETSSARHFVFTSSHDILVGGTVNDPSSDYTVMCIFQWQNGTQVLVKPEAFMKESGATYKYPPWQGPWSK